MKARRPSHRTSRPRSRSIKRAARGDFAIRRAEITLDPIAEEQFVAKHFFVFGQDGLAGHKARSGWRRYFSGCGSGWRSAHWLYIGVLQKGLIRTSAAEAET